MSRSRPDECKLWVGSIPRWATEETITSWLRVSGSRRPLEVGLCTREHSDSTAVIVYDTRSALAAYRQILKT
jgi:hypothetical protein